MKARNTAFGHALLSISIKQWTTFGILLVVLAVFTGCKTLFEGVPFSSEGGKVPLTLSPPSKNDPFFFTSGLSKPPFLSSPIKGPAPAHLPADSLTSSDQQTSFSTSAKLQQNAHSQEPQRGLSATAAAECTPTAQNVFQGKAVKPISCSNFLCPLTTFRSLRLMQRPIDQNVITLLSAAVDHRRNRVYVIGRLTPHIAVLDGVTEEWISVIDSFFPFEDIKKKLFLDPIANYLYLIDLTNQQLKRMDLSSGEIIGPVILPEGNGTAAVDSLRGRLYLLSKKPPYLTVFDGKSLNHLITNNELPATISAAAYYEKTDTLYILNSSSGSQGELVLWDPKLNKIKAKFPFTKEPSATAQALELDPAGERFFILSGKKIAVIQNDGKTLLQLSIPQNILFQAMAYDPAHDILAVLGITCPQGVLSCRGGHLLFFNPTLGNLVHDLAVGDAPTGLVFNPTNFHFYVFGEDEAALWSISADTLDEAYSIPLGDSIEQIAVAQRGGKIYWNSRLGENYLIGYNVDEGAYEVIPSGRQPLPLRVTQTQQNGENLLVLNAWDSSLTVFRTQPQTQWVRTIPLGLPANISKCLPDLSVDSQRGLVYTAFPQFGKIIIADWINGNTIDAMELQNFSPDDSCSAQAQIQVLINAEQQQLYVLLNQKQNHHLLIMDSLPPYSLIKEVNVEDLDWEKINRSAKTDLLFLDQDYNRLFIGPYVLDTHTLLLTNQKLSRGQSVFAIDPLTDSYWAIGLEGERDHSSYVVMSLFRKSLSMRQSQVLSSARTLKPVVAFDLQRRLIYVADTAKAELQVFAVGNLR